MNINEKIKNLLENNEIILFMKGDKFFPKCGFSKQARDILNELEVKYTTYDILEDEELRQALKEYSNWPTYPQLYFKEELIGGCDIIKEMYLEGELEELFQKL
jgi:monothiol glutaredoxin